MKSHSKVLEDFSISFGRMTYDTIQTNDIMRFPFLSSVVVRFLTLHNLELKIYFLSEK